MGLIDDDGVVATQQGITLRLGKQNAVSHELDRGLSAAAVLKPNLIPDPLAQRGFELIGDSLSD